MSRLWSPLSVAGGRGYQMTPLGFEPNQFAPVELESTPLDHSGKKSLIQMARRRGKPHDACHRAEVAGAFRANVAIQAAMKINDLFA
jgi:hypothetical protein